MNKARQLLVTPIEPTWDQLLTKWYEEEYQGKEFKEGTPLILTEKGERVRSKSEKILADYFYRKNILREEPGAVPARPGLDLAAHPECCFFQGIPWCGSREGADHR